MSRALKMMIGRGATAAYNPLSDWSLPPLHAFSTADSLWTAPADGGAVSYWRNGGSAMKGAYIGAKGLVCPGNTTTARTDCAIIADSAVMRPTGDMEVIVKATATDWTPAAGKVLVLSGSNGAHPDINWYLYYNTGGTLTFHRPAGATARMFNSSVATGIADGATKWIKVTYDQDNGAGNSECKFYLSDDGSTWAQLGTTQTYASTAAGNSNTTGITIGQAAVSAAGHAGTIHRVIAKDGIGGTTFLDVDFETATEDATSFTESSSNAATVTINSVAKAAHISADGLALPGVTGNYATAPDSSALSVTGDIEIVANVTLSDWTPTNIHYICGKGDGIAYDYVLFVKATTGILQLRWYDGAARTADSTVAPTVSDGASLWIKATLDVNNGAGGCDVAFYTSSDGSSWTQLGATVTQAFTTSISDRSTAIGFGCIGAGQGGTAFKGTIKRVITKNGINGTTVLDADFESATPNASQFTESSSNAATVTINSSVNLAQTTGSKQPSYDAANASYNNAPTVHFATDDVLVSDITDIVQPYYMVVIGNVDTAGVASDVFIGYGAATGNGLYEFSGGGYGSAISSTYALGGTSNTSPHLIRAGNNGALSSVIVDESPAAFGTVTGAITVLSLGAGNNGVSTFGYHLTGDIHTALVFKSDPSLQPEWADFLAYVESTIGIDVTPSPVTLQAPTLLDSALYSPVNTCTSASISPSADSLLIITCVSAATTGTFAFSSTTLSGISSMGMIQQSSGNERVGILWAKISGSPGTGTITITGFGSPGTDRAAMHVMEVVGAKDIRQTKIGTTTSATPSITLDYTPLSSSLVIGAIGLYGVTISAGTGFTELSESNANRALETQYDLTSAAASVGWTLSSSALNAMAAIEVTD